MLNRLSYYIDELRSDGKIDYDVYLNLREMSDQLGDENAALRERLSKAVELPVPLGTPILKVWKNRVPEDDARMSFVDVWEITTVNFKLEHYPLWGKYYFQKGEEGRKAAEARLEELELIYNDKEITSVD